LVVSRFKETLGRNSFVAVLDASLQPDSSGGTQLSGTVRLGSGVRAVGIAILVVGSLILGGFLILGVVLLTRGSDLAGLPPLLFALGLGAASAIFVRLGLSSYHADAVRLIDEVSNILDVYG
jgi:hypothetical protein